MSTETSCHFNHLLQVYKISFKSDFIHVYSPLAGADNPLGTHFWCQQKHLVTSLRSFVTNLKKSLWNLILYTFFNDFIYVYSPRAWTDNPLGTRFWCKQKGLIALPICCKFKKNLFELWFYAYFFMLLYSPVAGTDNPLGPQFWYQQNYLVTSVICYKFLPLNDFLTFFLKKCVFLHIKA